MAHAKWAQQKMFVIAAKLFLTIIQFISVIITASLVAEEVAPAAAIECGTIRIAQ